MSYENLFEKHLYTKAALNRIPISGTFELLPVCNLDCKMCYVKKSMSEVIQSGGLRSTDEWISLGKRAVDAGMLFLLLTGGEPFLFPEFERLYTALHGMGLVIDINSNGTMIREEQIAWLKKKLPRHIKISLYGSSEESYERLCGDRTAFQKVINTFEMAKRAGITVYSSITVTPANSNELDEMLKLCEDFKIPVKATSYMFPPLRSAQTHIHEKYRLSPEDAAKATLDIVRKNNEETLFYQSAHEYTNPEYLNFFSSIPECSECGKMECRAGSCTFWVTWQGDMAPCAMMDFAKYPVMENHNFLDAWKGIQEVVNNISTPAECVKCPAKKACYCCAASAYCETGNTQTRPEYPCKMTQQYLQLMKEEYFKYAKKD